MDIKTYLAIGELAQAAAHLHGLTGPVEFTVCRPHKYNFDHDFDDDAGKTESETAPEEEFFYARQ